MSAVLKPLREHVGKDGWNVQFDRPDRPTSRKDWPALLRMLERNGVNCAA